jgi:hypothetical protein
VTERLRLIVLGAVGGIPFAGMAWEALHYLEGLRRLGHDVYYVEDTNAWPYDPRLDSSSPDCQHAVDYVARVMAWAGLADHWAYRAADPDGSIYGLSQSRFRQLFNDADALINWGGSTVLRDEHLRVPIRALLETDPGGGEILAAQGDPKTIQLLASHTHFFNWAENLGAPDCRLPAGPVVYQRTHMPVVLDWFVPPEGQSIDRDRQAALRFTTVANWYQPGAVEWDGERYAWSKHHQFLAYVDLPQRLGVPIELALGSVDEESVQLLAAHGWRVIDAAPIGTDILPFRDYIFGSDGEFTVAKDIYVRLRTGWFSDRSAYYLAAGKPVITQDTGFGRFLPTGDGLFSFKTMEEILDAFARVQSDYRRHCQAARALAEEHFRAETVLGRLVEGLRR